MTLSSAAIQVVNGFLLGTGLILASWAWRAAMGVGFCVS